jgi:hypothetical protein
MAWIQRLSVGDAVGSVLDGLGLAGGSELQSGCSDFLLMSAGNCFQIFGTGKTKNVIGKGCA